MCTKPVSQIGPWYSDNLIGVDSILSTPIRLWPLDDEGNVCLRPFARLAQHGRLNYLLKFLNVLGKQRRCPVRIPVH